MHASFQKRKTSYSILYEENPVLAYAKCKNGTFFYNLIQEIRKSYKQVASKKSCSLSRGKVKMKKMLTIIVIGMMFLSTLAWAQIAHADVVYHYDCKYLLVNFSGIGSIYIDIPAENKVNPGPYPYQFNLSAQMDVALRIRHILYSKYGTVGENHLSLFVDGRSVLEADSPANWPNWYPGGEGISLIDLGNLSLGTHYITMTATESDYYAVMWWEIISSSPIQSSTSVVCSPNAVSVGTPVTCTATVSGSNPTGTVTWSTSSSTGSFSQSVGTLSSGNCSTSYADTSLGTVTITATYSGDTDNAPSSGGTTLTENPTCMFLISPTFLPLSVKDNFTVTVNLTNVQNLAHWQVILMYNGTGLNLTGLWVPDDNVFAGHQMDMDLNIQGPRDERNGFSSAIIGADLLQNGDVIPNVENGVLCSANFTVISKGQWLIEVAVESNPLHDEVGGLLYSFWQNTSDAEQNALGSNCTVFVTHLIGDINNDGKVDIRDVRLVAKAYGSFGPDYFYPGSPASSNWNPACDLTGSNGVSDGKVDIRDMELIAANFGQHYP